MNKIKIARGSIWLMDLDPTRGREQAKKRPCLVISDAIFNNGPSELIVVLPLTSKFRPVNWHIQIDPPEGGLKVRSYIMADQIRTLSLDRIHSECLGYVSPKTLKLVEQRIKFLLHFD